MNNEYPLSEEECVKHGGHFWKYYDNTDILKPNFEKSGSNIWSNKPIIRYRGCPICGRIEKEVPAYWERIDDKI